MPNTQPRIRTIPQCLQAIKSLDKDTAVTENFIRNLCKDNKILFYKSNSKYLVNLDSLLDYLSFNQDSNTGD